ncbi:flagellar M-ring protein FliF [Pusillimonas sp. CC-YST705]|uniref:Flagellar M-ring protein n=1 Tax=Mesopusillimonas faecipullorum TaxID=2755040 RepID=A0ABS8CAF6_9BURK|nr:flagellar basal-body MS-ring/collar protein FliF [Mesopusillimonas faecipullorum]MCB5362837.1 flagellar M-ring protein FliF [Mesopusillimonas faecipullorum]
MTQKEALTARFPALGRLLALPLPLLLGVGAALVAALIVVTMWASQPRYQVLFAGIEDRDGGAIVNALSQMNVPYRFSDNGSAILVPADRVHEARLSLAGQGLPRSGNIGFELLDNTRFGASEFSEQLSYQRALEGELGNSIQSIHAVQRARVHLALPRESLFLRDRHPPSASVLVTLYPGRTLSDAQVAAITWLISSSVPKLQAEHVSVVDQLGRMLSSQNGQAEPHRDQQALARDVEQRTQERILTLLAPLVGKTNVRAQASAELDFAQREQTAEIYRPNQNPGQEAVRSKQLRTVEQGQDNLASGVPGALSNQPPGPVEAPITVQPPPADAPAADALATPGAASDRAQSLQNDATYNYEVDRTISHTKDTPGTIKRLSVAVVVNYILDAEGNPQALPPAELDKLTRLVKDAMGYSEARGDSVSVINSPFATDDVSVAPPFWQDEANQALALELGRYLLYLLIALFLWFKLIKPVLRQLNQAAPQPAALPDTAAEMAAEAQRRASEMTRYEENLNVARTLAEKDPRAVAMVMRSWMEKNGKD